MKGIDYMAYTPKPTLKNTLPNEGFFFLKEPIKCSDGTFEVGSVVRISAICFNEADHIAKYKIYSLNGSEIISDKYYFHEDDNKWNEIFAPLNDTTIASNYYNKVTVLREKEADIDCKQEILSFAGMIICVLAVVFLVVPIIAYFVLCDKSLTLAETLVSAIASAGAIVTSVVLEACLGKRKNNIVESIRQYELNSFFALEVNYHANDYI